MNREVTVLSTADQTDIFEVINEAAERYEGKIPAEAETDPYMPMAEVTAEMADMQFLGTGRDQLEGVIGIQERFDASLIRHLYVRPAAQREGIGTKLLDAGIDRASSSTILVGTWAGAEWAIDFYERFGFENLGTNHDLLSTYWDIPEHQLEASVVLRYAATG